MRFVLGLLVALLALPTFAGAQDWKSAKKRGLIVKYDKFEDATTVSTDVWEVGLGLNLEGGDLKAGALYQVPGKEPGPVPDQVVLVFVARGPDWQFLENADLILLADDSLRIPIGSLHHHGDVRTSRAGAFVREGMYATVSPEVFAQIAQAEKLEGKLGSRTFKFKGAHKKFFRAMAEELHLLPPKS